MIAADFSATQRTFSAHKVLDVFEGMKKNNNIQKVREKRVLVGGGGYGSTGTRVDGSSKDQQLLFVSMCVCVPALLKCSFKTQEC